MVLNRFGRIPFLGFDRAGDWPNVWTTGIRTDWNGFGFDLVGLGQIKPNLKQLALPGLKLRWRVEGMLDSTDVAFILDMHQRHAPRGDLDDPGNMFPSENNMQRILGDDKRRINRISNRSDYSPYATIRRTPEEGVHLHADNSRWDVGSRMWVPNLTPWQTFTASVMLTSDYTGARGA